MKRVRGDNEGSQNGRIQQQNGEVLRGGQWRAEVAGMSVKIRRVDQNGAICLPADIYRTIFEKLVSEGEVELGRRQCLDLHAVSVVCTSFYNLINELIGKILSSIDTANWELRFGKILLPNGWSILATFYVYAVRSLGVKVCPNTQLAKTNVLVCEEYVQRFEEKMSLLFNVGCKVDITENGYEIVSNGRIFKFDERNKALRGALNKFVQYLCLDGQIFRQFDHRRRVLDFLLANNSIEELDKIIEKQVSFFCEMCMKDEAIFSVSFLNYWVLSGSMSGKNALILASHAFGMIQDNRIKPIERSSILTVLTLLLRMSLIKLRPEVVQYLRQYAFFEFAAIDWEYPVQRKDKAMFLIQELLVGGYALNLSLSELGIVKQFAVERLAYPYGGPNFKRDIIELLSLIVEKEELFSFDLVKSFECIRDHVVKVGEQHNPLMIQRIVRTFDRFLEHPDENICFLASEISLSIGSILPD